MSYIKLWYLQCFSFFIKIYRGRGSDCIKLAYKSTILKIWEKCHSLLSYLLLLLFHESGCFRNKQTCGTRPQVSILSFNFDWNQKFQFWVSSNTDPARNDGEGKRVKTLLRNKTCFWKMTVILRATAVFLNF